MVTLAGLGSYPIVKVYLTDKNTTDSLVGSYEFVGNSAEITLDTSDEQIYRVEVQYNN